MKINRIQLYLTSKCQLKCEFCPCSNWVIPSVYMPMTTFTKYVDMCCDYGITEFELTPMVGEAFLDPEIINKILYVSNKPSTTLVFIYTNLLSLTEPILIQLSGIKKFHLRISMYGDTPVIYYQRTNKHLFDLFLHKFKLLCDYNVYNKNCIHIKELVIRYPGFTLAKIKKEWRSNKLYKIIYTMCLTKQLDFDHSFSCTNYDLNWNTDMIHVTNSIYDESAEYMKDTIGLCQFAIDDLGIWPNGDVGICACWFDINKKQILYINPCK